MSDEQIINQAIREVRDILLSTKQCVDEGAAWVKHRCGRENPHEFNIEGCVLGECRLFPAGYPMDEVLEK